MAEVLIVDDYEPWLRLVQSQILSQPGLVPVATAADGFSAIQRARELAPDVVLLDINLPGCSGFEAAREIRKITPRSHIIFVSLFFSLAFVEAALDLGARGFLSKNDHDELLLAIQVVLAGERYLSKSIRHFPFQR